MLARVTAALRRLPLALEMALVIGLAFGRGIAEGLMLTFGGPARAAPVDHDSGILVLVARQLATLALLLPFLHLRGWPLRGLRPRITARGSAIGLALCLLAFVSYLLLRTAFRAIAHAGPDPPSIPPSPLFALLLIVINPIFEELLSACYVITALARFGPVVAVGAGTLLRVSYHLYQGWAAATASMLTMGIVFGAYYWRSRDLWAVIVAHAAADVIGVALL